MRRERRNFQGAAGYSVSNTAQPTKGKEIMGKRIEDLKETAPCGMLIHYTVNEEDIEACEGRETCKSRNSCGECKNYMIPKGQEPCKSCKNVRG